ncbi:MAG: hypothetical protein WC943_16910, partial [Elusimicrobiota bacterium]
MRRFLAVAVPAALLFGCSSPAVRVRAPEPTSPTNGSLAARVFIQGGWFSAFKPYSLTFQRLKADGKPEEEAFVSNFRSGDNVYLLDVLPGRYVPVSVRFMRQNNSRDIEIPENLRKDLGVEVRSGEVVFAGLLNFAVRGRAGKKSVFTGRDVSKEAEIAALDAALQDLDGTLWRDAVSRRRDALGPSES